MPAKDKPEDDVIREKMWVTREKNTHLSQSKKTPGQQSPLTRDNDSNELGQVTLSAIEDEAEDWSQPSIVYVDTAPLPKSAAQEALEREIQERIGQLIDIVVAKAKPHVKKFHNEKALPAFQTKWENRPRRKSRKQLPASEPMSIAEMRVVVSQEVEESTAEYRQNMSSQEAQARIVLALFLRELSDEQLTMVANAGVEFDEGIDDLQRKLAGLPQEQVTYMIESLMADPSLVEDQLLGFQALLGLAPPDGEPLPTQER